MLASYLPHRRKLDRLLSDYRHAKQSVADEKQLLKEAKTHLQAVAEAQERVQTAAESIQNIAHQKIATVVTKCLQTVFGEEYEFRINFVKRRNRTEAELVFVKDGHEVDPTMSSGGGILDIASFALRLSCLILMQPHKRRVLILDEPMRFVSSNHIPTVRSLLLELSQSLGMQYIIVTHNSKLVCGKVIEVGV